MRLENSYKDSGVDIEAGDATVDKIKDLVKSTFNKNVLTGIGHFGAFFELDLKEHKNPVLVSSVDGVGTKLKVAIDSGIHDTVGQDLVNHCINDIAVCGAKPLYFMDYMAFGKLEPNIASNIVSGFAKACKENGVALIGGETAEMPGLYQLKDYDLSGTIVGVVDKTKIIDGCKIRKGNILVGFKSNGLHTNGYSLARKVLLNKFNLDENISEINSDLKTELLKVHKSYLELIQSLIAKIEINAFSHITGGGIVGNTKRVVPDGLKIEIDWSTWEVPPIFKLIKNVGNISDNEMRKVFNMGIGLIAVIDEVNLDQVRNISASLNEEPIILGNIV
ncbi:MAG: phosphoribosylformylglycinamidine cyclo-ligase [Ignavibacteriales bacterium]|nr:phosphoribosylformylglycinamidine cyclo-ligase [Ignavibacteriales bacterium]MCB9257964.1 phosphoribosylformylglycinamidine cyclo-ligase [Ignavibacteriales bacterium]